MTKQMTVEEFQAKVNVLSGAYAFSTIKITKEWVAAIVSMKEQASGIPDHLVLSILENAEKEMSAKIEKELG